MPQMSNRWVREQMHHLLNASFQLLNCSVIQFHLMISDRNRKRWHERVQS